MIYQWRIAIPLFLVLAGLALGIIITAAIFMRIGVNSGFGDNQVNLLLIGFVIFASGVVLVTPLGRRLLAGKGRQAASEGQFGQHIGGDLSDLLVVGLWFGLVAGLVEGVGFLAAQKLGVWTRISVEILWVSPVFYGFFFGACALAFMVAGRCFPQAPVARFSVFMYAFLAIFPLVSLIETYTRSVHDAAVLILSLGLALVLFRWFGKLETMLAFWHRSLPAVATLVLLVVVGVQGGGWLEEKVATANLPPASAGSPSVLIIVVDTLRADHLSSYGYKRPTSPNIDAMALQGVLFENAFSASSFTAPSHASLLTGLYPYEHGWLTSKTSYGRHSTLPGILRARGYRTGAFSANDHYFTREQGFGSGFLRFEDYFHSVSDMFLRTVYGRKAEQMLLKVGIYEDYPARKWSSDINRSFLRWLDGDAAKPFFVFLNYLDTHDPYIPPQPYRSRFSPLEKPGGILSGPYWNQLEPQEVQSEIDAYDGAISYVDVQIGDLMRELQNRGLSENLLVVITSDHGEAFGEHGTFFHANSLYREEISVPLIFWKPGRTPVGLRISHPVSNVSVAATVIELVDAADQSSFSGPSLQQLWESPEGRHDWDLPLAELGKLPWATKKSPNYHGYTRSLVSPEWHYIEHETQRAELYDWKDDPLERENLAQSPGEQAVVTGFRALLEGVTGPPARAGKKGLSEPVNQ